MSHLVDTVWHQFRCMFASEFCDELDDPIIDSTAMRMGKRGRCIGARSLTRAEARGKGLHGINLREVEPRP